MAEVSTRPGPTADSHASLGQFLRAVREHKGLSLLEMETQTRVHRNHLSALEAGDLSRLPSRPFTIGYVRSYARALGLDPDTEVSRFKSEFPDAAEPLRAPIGVAHQEVERRHPIVYVAVGLVVTAVVLWNVAQRTLSASAPTPSGVLAIQEAPPPAPVNPGQPITVGAPTSASVEQNTPAAYVTPGLEGDVARGPHGEPLVKPSAPLLGAPPVGAIFEPRGAVYGAAALPNTAVLQASKRIALIIRGPGGEIYFARPLAPGEAYRAPIGRGLSAETADPNGVNLYVGGRFKAALTDMQTPLDRVAAVAPPPAPASPQAPVQVAAAPAAAPAPAAH